MISLTTSKLESLVTNLIIADFTEILNELKMPKYQNIVAFKLVKIDLDLQNGTMSIDSFAQCICELLKLRSLNIFKILLIGCLQSFLCILKCGLLELSIACCALIPPNYGINPCQSFDTS